LTANVAVGAESRGRRLASRSVVSLALSALPLCGA
jgi:hypothetical protein